MKSKRQLYPSLRDEESKQGRKEGKVELTKTNKDGATVVPTEKARRAL